MAMNLTIEIKGDTNFPGPIIFLSIHVSFQGCRLGKKEYL